MLNEALSNKPSKNSSARNVKAKDNCITITKTEINELKDTERNRSIERNIKIKDIIK